jgi:GNAT superfamily N-acetyltransferase
MTGAPDIVVRPLGPDHPPARQWRMIEEVFFLSTARRRFASAAEKQRFFDRWTGYYRDSEPHRFLLAMAPDGRVAGYLTGCADSRAARRLYDDIPYYDVFEDLFEAYPAHLHVNCHPDFRGRGIGTRLVDSFVQGCAAADLSGVHLVTTPAARNVGFYRRCGFDFSETRAWQDRKLLFLAMALPKP